MPLVPVGLLKFHDKSGCDSIIRLRLFILDQVLPAMPQIFATESISKEVIINI